MAAPTRHFTRPVVLSLRNAMRAAWFESALADRHQWPRASVAIDGSPSAFEPQRMRALRRLKVLAAGAVILVPSLALLFAMFKGKNPAMTGEFGASTGELPASESDAPAPG